MGRMAITLPSMMQNLGSAFHRLWRQGGAGKLIVNKGLTTGFPGADGLFSDV